METSGPTSGIPPIAASAARTTNVQWQVGQLLQATVTENSVGKVLLAIGNRQISADTSLPLQKGQQLTLEVRSLGEPPVLRIMSAINESLNAMATRLLLPRQGPLTPLLSSMQQLTQTPNPPIPPLINQLVRDIVKQLPDVATVSNPLQLKKTIENSGIFMERRLLQHLGRPGGGLTLDMDFKANLLRLVQLVRNWPGSSARPEPSMQAPANQRPAGAGPQAATPRQGAVLLPDIVRPQDAAPTPAQIGRVVLQAGPATPSPAATPGTAATLTAATALPPGPASQPAAGAPGAAPPPPLPGTVPVPQAAVAASLDLLNRFGNLRTDLLQQVEAALARAQLQQLATLPREGERALLEWLLELPVRRGEEIDLWSMRIFREPPESRQPDHRQAPGWTVQIAVDLPQLGPLQIHVRLAGEQVSTRFWVERPETLPLLREHMHELRRALLDAGLEVGDLDCQSGAAPPGRPGSSAPLIDEKV